ncbi:sugar ABC transporter substrate-binding protein [Microbacterium sp. 179-I 3D3 NHS]|uniref:sugar ABC transporter substrate-binding protein n=1 Tax=unclassified Microbacterium TaxID=2609290 RepID=UPI0039A20CD5
MKLTRKAAALTAALVAVSALSLSACSSDGGSGAAPSSEEKPNIAVIWKDGSSPFWLAAKQGSEDGKAALGDKATVTISAGNSETDVASQIAKVENAITAGAGAIVIAPSAPDQLKPVLTKAMEQGIEVLLVDTPIEGFDATFIGTDNKAGGAEAFASMAEALPDGGKIGLIGGAPGVTSTDNRLAGFQEAAEGSNFTLLEPLATQSCDQASGVKNAENLITANPDLAGIFIACGQPALGAIQAIKSANLSGEITVVGFDFDKGADAALDDGSAYAFISQFPDKMGSMGVESAYTVLTGGSIEKSIDTGVAVITKDNVDEYR